MIWISFEENIPWAHLYILEMVLESGDVGMSGFLCKSWMLFTLLHSLIIAVF